MPGGECLVNAPLLVTAPRATETVDEIDSLTSSGLQQQCDSRVVARPDLGGGAIEMIKTAVGGVDVEPLLHVVHRLLASSGAMGSALPVFVAGTPLLHLCRSTVAHIRHV